MLFRIDGDNAAIIKNLKEFTKLVEEEWGPAVKYANEKMKNVPLPIKIPEFQMDEIVLPYWEEKGAVFMRVPVAMPGGSIGGKLIGRKARKKMEKNLKGFMEAKGIQVKVKHCGD